MAFADFNNVAFVLSKQQQQAQQPKGMDPQVANALAAHGRPNDALAYERQTTPAPNISSVLRQGSTGAEVRLLQNMLGIPVDGSFGPQTRQAVMNFQRANGLTVDGIVGPQTLAALSGTAPKQNIQPAQQQAASTATRVVSAAPASAPAATAQPMGSNQHVQQAQANAAAAQQAAQQHMSQGPVQQAIPQIDWEGQYSQQAARYQAELDGLMADLQRLMSPEHFNALMQEVMKSQQGLIDSNRADIDESYGELARQMNIDAERRGMFMSGAAGENVKDVGVAREREVQRMIAQLQLAAGEQASKMVDQQLTSRLGAADTATKYAQLSQNDRQFMMNLEQEYQKMNQAERQFFEELGLKKQMRADDMQKFADNMQMQYYQLDQQQRQFMEEMGFKRQQLASQQQIARMNYESSKAAAQANNDLALMKFELEKQIAQTGMADQKLQNDLQKATVTAQAWDQLNTGIMGVKSGTTDWAQLQKQINTTYVPILGQATVNQMMNTGYKTIQQFEKEQASKQQSGVLTGGGWSSGSGIPTPSVGSFGGLYGY